MAISPLVAAPNLQAEAVAVDTVPDGETNNEHQASLPASLVVQAAAASGEDGNNKKPVLSDLAVVDILDRWINSKDDLPPFVHHRDLYQCSPWEAVQGLKHARWETKHGGREETWFIVSQDGNRCGRKVGEAGTWHGERRAQAILGADGNSVVANKKRFSYKMGTPGKSRKQESTGWIMMQYSLEGAHQNPHKVINTVYKSSHAKTWVEARSYAIAGADQEDIEISVDAPVPAPAVSKASGARFRATAVQKGKAALAVAAVSRDGEKADATQLSLTRGIPIDLLLQAARKAVHCVDYKEAVQIKEFEAAKLIYHTSMTELGLDSTILSGSLIQLDLLIQHVAMTKELTPNGRDHLVCLAEGMSGTIFSEYLNELPTRGRQAFNALERLGVDVQEALQMPSKGMKISPLVIPDGEAKDFALEFLLSAAALVAAGNKRPIPASFTAASSSGVKRLRQERTETTSPIATLEEAQRHLMPDEYPVDGGDKAEDYTEMYANMLRDKITPIGGGGGGGADGFVVAIPEGEGYPAGFFYMPGVADNLEEPVGAHGFPGGVVALAPHMAEPPSAPCRFPEESDLHQFALKDSACRSLVGAEDSAPGTAFRYYDDFSANNGTGGSTDYPNGGAAGSNGLAAGGGERQVHDLPMDIDGLSDLEDIDMFDIDEYLAMPEF